jgi:hypothetical protein
MEHLFRNGIEASPDINGLRGVIARSHADFLKLAPGFDRDIWLPYDAILNRKGSCAAEAFFVAKELLASGIVNKKDLSMGVFRNHGDYSEVGFIGKTKQIPGHAILIVTISGQAYELSFRMDRVDQKPTLERVTSDSMFSDRFKWVDPISEALVRYGDELSDSRGRLVRIEDCDTNPIGGESQISLNEDF